jgi:hypothetical protein
VNRLAVIALIACGSACGSRRTRAKSTTTFVVRVTDGVNGPPVAARVLLLDATETPLHIGGLDLYGKRQGGAACAIAPGVIGSWDGLILGDGTGEVPIGVDTCTPSPGIPYGHYTVWAWRGVEYEKWVGQIDLHANRGRVELTIPLERAWKPDGTLAADLHVHASASNDSRMPNPQRVRAQLAAGIQVIALTDHNTNGDLDADIAALGAEDRIASIAGNELTSNLLHANVYPVPVDRNAPRGGAPPEDKIINGNAEQLFAFGHAMSTNPIVQVNHPRFRVNSLYDTAHWNGTSWPPPFPLNFDAVEVLAGYAAFNVPGDRRLDDGVRDLYTFYDHGHLVTPVANSDTHDLNWVLDGTARTYVYVDDPRTKPFDEDAFIAAIRARRTVATTGPWLDVEAAPKQGATPTVGPGQSLVPDAGGVWLDITVAQTAWVKAERIRITVGGKLAQEIEIPAGKRTFQWTGRVEVGADTDTWIGVTADGDTAMPLALTGTYQKDKWNHAGVTPFALISPILVDVNGDHRWVRGDADLAL